MKSNQHSAFNVQRARTARSCYQWMFKMERWALNVPAFVLVFAIHIYRWTISPVQTFLFGPGAGCRFTPTCSQYAMAAVRQHGALAGGWLAAKRICRDLRMRHRCRGIILKSMFNLNSPISNPK